MLKTFSILLLGSFIYQSAHSQSPFVGESLGADSNNIHTLAKIKLPALSSLMPTPDTLVPSAPVFTFSGYADVYYRYDLARQASNDLTSFTHSHNEFNLGMVSLKIGHKTTKTDFVADLGLGPRQQDFAYNDKGISQAIKQLYLAYSVTDWLKVTAGTWVTHLCIESLDPPSNRNYSMSYMFTNGPFSHTGIKAEVSSGKSNWMIGVANPTDFRSIPDSGHSNKNILAQYSYIDGDAFRLYLSYVGGRDSRNNRIHQYDLVLSVKASSLFSFGLNTTANRSSLAGEEYTQSRTWWGAALYCNADPKSWLGLTLRTEYFHDQQGVKLPAPASIFATTLSANLKTHGLTFIPEWRLDYANNPLFTHSNGSPAHAASNFLLAAVYSF